MSILSENIEPGFKLGDIVIVTVGGAGGWCNNTTCGKIRNLKIPALEIDPTHLLTIVKDVLIEEVRYYAKLWFKNITDNDIRFGAYYDGYDNQIVINVHVDDDRWCHVAIKQNKYVDNKITFTNLKHKAYYDLG